MNKTTAARRHPALFLPDALPPELREGRSFVAWRYETRDGKKTKPPINPRTGKHANSTDPSTWTDLRTAVKAVDQLHLEGVGRVVSDVDPYTGVDIDKCIDAKGKLSPIANSIVKTLSSYTEVTPSGRGLRVWIRAKLPKGARNRKGNVEIYSRSRFFTLTGHRWKDAPPTVEARQAELEQIHRTLFPEEKREAPSGQGETSHEHERDALNDSDLLSRARRRKHFADLWDGDTTEYDGDESRADYHVCRVLAELAGNDPARIESLFSKSKLALRGKWQGRFDYRKRTIERAIRDVEETRTPARENGEAVSLSLVTVRASDIVPSHLAWLWPNRIPRGKLTVFCGPPDVGKSATATDVIARGTTGREWPDAPNPLAPFEVLMLVDEDNLSDTVVPRLMAAGAHLPRVHFATQTHIHGRTRSETRHIALDTDLAAVEEFLAEHPGIQLVVLDPLAGYLGKLKKNGEEEIRFLLRKAKELAERFDVSVLTLDHFNKNYEMAGIHRLSGAGALAAVPRAVWAFVKDPDDDQRLTRLMLNLKLNVVEESKKTGMRYRFASAPVMIGDKPADQPVLDWKGATSANIDEVLHSEADPKERRSVKAAKFLTRFLAGGPRPFKEIEAEGKKVGLSRNALYEAKDALDIRPYRVAGSWWWEIAPDPNASTVVH